MKTAKIKIHKKDKIRDLRPKRALIAIPSSPVEQVLPQKSLDELTQIRQTYLERWSDPMNTQSEGDLSQELGVPISQLVTWRMEPSFYEVAYRRYSSALRSSVVPVLRKLVIRAHEGDREAVRQFLEITGILQSKGPTINVLNTGGTTDSFQSSMIRDLSDDDLDREIGQAFTHLYSSDIRVEGKVVAPIQDAEVVEVK